MSDKSLFFKKMRAGLGVLSLALGAAPSQVCAQSIDSLLIGSEHTYYVGSNQHVQQIYFTANGPVYQDLTALSGTTVLPTTGSALSTLLLAADHVFYFGTNHHVNQLYFTGSSWVNQDATAAAGTTALAAPGSAIATLPLYGLEHVYYFDVNRHIWQVFNSGSGWMNMDITAAAGTGTIAEPDSALASANLNNTDHLFYVANLHINQVSYTGASWVNQDLSAIVQAPYPASPGTAITSYVDPNNMVRVYYFDSNRHINEMKWNGQAWLLQDVTAVSGTDSRGKLGSPLEALYNNGAVSVHYVDDYNHVNEISWNGQTWVHYDLTAMSGTTARAGQATTLTDLTIGGGTHIYYFDQNGHVNQLYWAGYGWVAQDLAGWAGAPAALPSGNLPNTSFSRDYVYLDGKRIAVENAAH